MKIKKIFLVLVNSFLVVSTALIVWTGVSTGADEAQPGFEEMVGLGFLRAYTNLSNIFVGLIALCLLVETLRQIKETKIRFPSWLTLLQYIGTVSITVTMITVILFLSPMRAVMQKSFAEYFFLFENEMFFFHFFNPILMIVEYFYAMERKNYGRKENAFSLIPMGLYAILYVCEVVVFCRWNDFYGFTFGGKVYMIPIAIIVMFGATYAYGLLFRKMKKEK